MTTPSRRAAFPESSPDPSGDFPFEVREYIFYLLFQAARRRDLAVEALLDGVGLNLPGWRALAVVRRIDDCTMKALARYSTIDRTTLTRTVDQLVDQGKVERCVPSHDRRQVNLGLSPEGSAVYDVTIRRVMQLNRRTLDGIEEADLKTTARVLQALLANLVDDPVLLDDLLTFGWGKGDDAERLAELDPPSA